MVKATVQDSVFRNRYPWYYRVSCIRTRTVLSRGVPIDEVVVVGIADRQNRGSMTRWSMTRAAHGSCRRGITLRPCLLPGAVGPRPGIRSPRARIGSRISSARPPREVSYRRVRYRISRVQCGCQVQHDNTSTGPRPPRIRRQIYRSPTSIRRVHMYKTCPHI